jgi:hypothetical protein
VESTSEAIKMMERCMNKPRKINTGEQVVSAGGASVDDAREIDAAELHRELHELKLGLTVLSQYVERVELQVLGLQLAGDEGLAADIRAIGGGATVGGTEYQIAQLNDLLKRD